jgi:hypothetical protein
MKREHSDKCPEQENIGYVLAPIECPECDKHGYHPTRQCKFCGYALCWCLKGGDEERIEELIEKYKGTLDRL